LSLMNYHAKMQEYVNVDYRRVMAIVGLTGEAGQERIIAEARYVKPPHHSFADMAFVVDEQYQKVGIATYLYKKLVLLAKERGVRGFTADVLATNKGMMKVFEKGGLPVTAHLESGAYHLTIPFDVPPSSSKDTIRYEYKRG